MKQAKFPSTLSLLASCVALLGGCASAPSAPTTEGVLLPSFGVDGERQWNIGHQAENEVGRITEFVRPEENVENWTELLTVLTYDKALIDLVPLEEVAEQLREDFVSQNPGSTLTVIREEPNSVLFESHVKGSGAVPDEDHVARILDGWWKRFLISYAVRAPVIMTPERRAEWIEWLSETSILRR